MTTLHDFGGVLGRSWDTFIWALTILMVTALGSSVKWALEHPQRARQRLPSTALGRRGNFGTPQWAREDSRQSPRSRQILPGP
jgi:hypothetical protein